MAIERTSSPFDADQPRNVADLTKRNVETVVELEKSARLDRTKSEGFADAITGFFGRVVVIYVHITWFAVWMGVNVLLPKKLHFDPYPFEFLVLALSLEAIFLSIFILISQNRQGKLDERRNHLELQINLLAEQENTKMLWMLQRIATQIGVHMADDPAIEILEEATRPEKLLEQIDNSLGEDSEKL